MGKYLQEHLTDNSPGRIIYGSNLDKYYVVIGMDDFKKKGKKNTRYDGKRLAAACLICHCISYFWTHQPCSCDWMSMKPEKISVGSHF